MRATFNTVDDAVNAVTEIVAVGIVPAAMGRWTKAFWLRWKRRITSAFCPTLPRCW